MTDKKAARLCAKIDENLTTGKIVPLYDAIRKDNQFDYKCEFEKIVRRTLTALHEEVVTIEELPSDHVLLSYHASSVVLRRWIRVTHSRNVWNRTTFSQTEIDFFREIYEWDARPGHIMTDPKGPGDIEVVFCRNRPASGMNCIPAEAWGIARRLLHSVVFPLLVKHELDDIPLSNHKAIKKRSLESKGIEIDDWQLKELATLAESLKGSGIWEPDNFENATPMFQVRSFLVTFFYTIGRCTVPNVYGNSTLTVIDGCCYERIIARSVYPQTIGFTAGEDSEKIGSLALVTSHTNLRYNCKLLTAIRQATDLLAKSLRCLEFDVASATVHTASSATEEEDRIRLACEVDWEDHKEKVKSKRLKELTKPLHEKLEEISPKCRLIPYDLHKKLLARDWEGPLDNNVKNLIEHGMFSLDDEITSKLEKQLCSSCLYNEIKEEMEESKQRKDQTLAQFIDEFKMVGASRAYVDLIDQLDTAVQRHDVKEPQVVFLHSEPGCGKENIAGLIHLMSSGSKAIHLSKHCSETLPSITKADPKEFLERSLNYLSYSGDPTMESKEIFSFSVAPDEEETRTFKLGPKWNTTRLFNYFPLNMATLHKHELFTKELFGTYSPSVEGSAGRCLLAHLLHGSVFLDEFSTLPEPKWANCFLRLFEQPHEMDIQGRPTGPIVNANLLIICASNLSGEELIRHGFNEAVIYRMTRRSFRIPPLRDRQVDIAVFVNALLRKHNSEIHKKKRIRRIDTHAMRLLCELPWPDNYRGIQALLSEISEARHRRSIAHEELSFEEVVEGLRRRETLQAATRHQSAESQMAVFNLAR